jgi:hypothetical protein
MRTKTMGKKRRHEAGGPAPELGELRSVLTHRRDSQGWALVRSWAEQAWYADPQQFNEVWLPYLLGHLADWPAQVCDAPRRWMLQALEPGGFGPLRLARRIHVHERRLTDEDWALLPRLVELPETQGIELLHMQVGLSARELEALSQPGAWPALRELISVGGHTGEVARAMLPQLERLVVGDIYAVSDAPRGHAAMPALRHLGLPRARLAGGLIPWLRLLGGRVELPALESLDLSEGRLATRRADWEGVLLADAPQLREVNIAGAFNVRSDNLLGAFGPDVEVLDMSRLKPNGTALLDDDLLCSSLRHSAPHSPLERLSLAGTSVGQRSIIALGMHSALPDLVALDLSRCSLMGPIAMLQLSRVTHLGALRALNLSGCPLDSDAIGSLASWPLLPQLTLLDLRHIPLTHHDAALLREAGGPELTLLHDEPRTS